VEVERDPAAALARARERQPVLVTGSLYLLAALARNEA
jgi:folylpolyglutamate synthase/dihydropteroate synthase